jgi:hypothetical protein
MSYSSSDFGSDISVFDKVIFGILGLLMVLAIILWAEESKDRGRCLKTEHIKATHYWLSRPPMWQTIPAHDVCDEWEFPKGRP